MNVDLFELVDDVLEEAHADILKDGNLEIYESKELQDQSDQSDLQSHMDQEDTEEDAADYQLSRAVFENQTLENSRSDFSNNLSRTAAATFGTSYVEEENVAVRLARIRRELEEIEMMKGNELDSEVSTAETKLLRGLSNQLNEKLGRQTDNIQQRLQIDSTEEPNFAKLPDFSLNFENGQRIMRLEAQIAKLESLVGISDSHAANKPLTTSLNELYRDIRLLKGDTAHLGQFKTKLAEISDEYEKRLLARKASNDLAMQAQIQDDLKSQDFKIKSLYDSYDVLIKYKEVLPHLVTRLKALNSLHLKIDDTVGTVKTMGKSLNWVSDQTTKWQQMLEQMDQKLSANEEQSKKNMQEVTDWLNKMEERIQNFTP
ncbi:LAME_0H01090g1_1 [Lachancea meyersii CBS 8951]|uniref:LAME_0H01090g1_1 n=1 Tax=Lachancea meyersii CBS 8951 TaxID=1266667 RepID=A0A1G4KD86_9SACH|nr:LAME_0H01090g1_1 [Lachancea meyersii CBS 8951]